MISLKHLAKDLRLGMEQGMHTPGGLVLYDSFRQADAAGLGDEDIAAILKFVGGGHPA